MNNLFSSFNPNSRLLTISLPLNWISFFIIPVIIPKIYWVINRKPIFFLNNIIRITSNEIRAIYGGISQPGTILSFISIFVSIIMLNIIGLFPYIFTPTSHLSTTLSLRLPLWLGYIIIRCKKQAEYNLAHLVPEGTPSILIPIIVLIESIRLIIRPFTLAVRLAANMIAGHLLLCLLGSYGVESKGISTVTILISLCILVLLELSVGLIQAYVYIRLRSLYSSEHNSHVINTSVK